MEREIICTSCPMGCHVMVELDGEQIVKITGNTCARGERYARAEVTDPKRTITTTVALVDGGVLPIKSDAPLSKKNIDQYLKQIHEIVAERPVLIGDVLLADIDGNGVNIVATQNAF
ncbi:MAG: DUF1667 domain-containing protein [Firmicutes bacterium]|nr:DUF1667 domain-containing protein [Bacillota bacterium]